MGLKYEDADGTTRPASDLLPSQAVPRDDGAATPYTVPAPGDFIVGCSWQVRGFVEGHGRMNVNGAWLTGYYVLTTTGRTFLADGDIDGVIQNRAARAAQEGE